MNTLPKMTMVRVCLTCLLLALVSSLSTPAGAAPCIDLRPSRSFHFEGVLSHQVFAGPPNYESVQKGDKPEPTYILLLKEPICVAGDEFIAANARIDRIQVFPDEENKNLWAELQRLVGQSVAVEGSEPFGAHTGHHHAPLLLPITQVRRAN